MASEKLKTFNYDYTILACQKSKITDWKEHFKTYYPDINVVDYTEKGAKIEKGIIVINYDLLFRRKEFLQLKKISLILDESSYICNPQAKRTKYIMKLDAENIILLSGTICSGKYENLWTHCKMLGWDISKTLYDRHYVNWKLLDIGGTKVKTIDKKNPYKNVERLKTKLREHGAVFLKTEDVMDLPEQNFIEMSISKPNHYSKFMKNSIVTVDGVELVGDTTLTKRLYARQLCGIYSEEKLQAFRDLVESTNDRLIVFYNFKKEAVRLMNIANQFHRPCSIICGDQKNIANYENCDDSITFVQYQAGAMGLNLQLSNKIIYYSLPERSELFEQSKKRIHRIGQNKPCFYYIMMCKGTVEENIYAALQRQKDFTDELFKGCDK